MQFMSVYTYEPEKRDEVFNRRAESNFAPEGAKCIGQWITSGRVFTLLEVNDNMTLFKWGHAFTDLGKFETYPVVMAEELMKVISAK
jgi:hypothetical protein